MRGEKRFSPLAGCNDYGFVPAALRNGGGLAMNVFKLPEIPGNRASISLEYFNTSDSVMCDIKANNTDQLAAMYGVLTEQLVSLGYLSVSNIYQIVEIATGDYRGNAKLYEM